MPLMLISPYKPLFLFRYVSVWENVWVSMSFCVGVEMTQALECEAPSSQTRRGPVLGCFPSWPRTIINLLIPSFQSNRKRFSCTGNFQVCGCCSTTPRTVAECVGIILKHLGGKKNKKSRRLLSLATSVEGLRNGGKKKKREPMKYKYMWQQNIRKWRKGSERSPSIGSDIPAIVFQEDLLL